LSIVSERHCAAQRLRKRALEKMESDHRRLGNDDDSFNSSETEQLFNTLYINIIIFCCLATLFELFRHMKSIYMNRLKSKFIRESRVPPIPSGYPGGWIISVMKISHDEVLRMIGLDGYMLLRYINACLRIACFCGFWGLIVMVPVYQSGNGGLSGWGQYTLGNVPDDPHSGLLWVPVIFSYVFTIFFCQIMYFEFKNYISKRVSYLEEGDLDTPLQTYYTVMLEKVSSSLRSTQILTDFFDRLFPNDVYTVEIALDLDSLDELIEHRTSVRNSLEKAIAAWKATGKRSTILVDHKFYDGIEGKPFPLSAHWTLWSSFGYERYDSIEHYSKLLDILNNNVRKMQIEFYEQRQKVDEIERNRLKDIKKVLEIKAVETATKQVQRLSRNLKETSSKVANNAANALLLGYQGGSSQGGNSVKSDIIADSPRQEGDEEEDGSARVSTVSAREDRKSTASTSSKPRGLLDTSKAKAQEVLHIGQRFGEGLAKEGLKTAEFATKGALRGVYEATRALELLTLGAYYRTSSTAFITFRSRFSACCCQQMLLSHEHYMIEATAAPNPNDVIWSNVSIPSKQIEIRRSIADSTLIVGAFFWSLVVAFISALANLESISQEIPALQNYSNTILYKFFNNYLAATILLILLALLPFVFDFISRSYEGIKTESEIQDSIMTRYFYYQLANVFVAVGLGSIANSLHQILQNPSEILSILGNSVPSFSIYFANLIITRTFTGIPIEMLRIFPLLDITIVMCCGNKNKYTRRELSQGAFADPPMVYGWIYPNILMGLMIMVTYSCVSSALLYLFCPLIDLCSLLLLSFPFFSPLHPSFH
jgi:hypothetical protein